MEMMGPIVRAHSQERRSDPRSLDWKFALPLKRGSQLKVECMCTAAELEGFADLVVTRGLGRVRAINQQDKEQSHQAHLRVSCHGWRVI